MPQTAAADSLVASVVQESLLLKQQILDDRELIRIIAQAGERIARALQLGRKLLFFGNGGSAADAQHLAAEFIGRFRAERPALPALALTVNTSSLTAIGNDYSYEKVFVRQLEGLGAPGDVAVGISTSGKSPNVLAALRAARELGMATIGMTGARGNALCELADFAIRVPSNQTPRIQEAHILIGHILCEIAERSFLSREATLPERATTRGH